jgi:hypothetical protein
MAMRLGELATRPVSFALERFMKLHQVLTAAAAALCCLATPALAQRSTAVAGEKLDSGLGQLPHYSKWADPRGGRVTALTVPGESLDSGLGELPPYRLWADRSGKDPMGGATPAASRYAAALIAQAPKTAKVAQASQ